MAEEMMTADINSTESQAETEVVETSAEASKEPKADELMAEIAQLKADMARNKHALDKALKEKGEITKKLREKQTAEEAEAEAKAEAEAARAEREAEKDRIIAEYEAKAMFAEMGISGKSLDEIVRAKVDGDEKTVYSIIVRHFENKYETALKTEKSEWLGKRPQVNVGVGSDTALTQKEFDRMGYKERVQFANEHPDLYKQFTENIHS